MIKPVKIILLLLSLVATAGTQSISAQTTTSDTSATYSLNVQQAVDFALHHNRNIKNILLDVEIARQRVNELTGVGLPQLSANGDLKYYAKAPVVNLPNFGKIVYDVLEAENLLTGPVPQLSPTIAASFFTKYVATGSIDASQIIFDGGYVVGVKAAKKYKELTQKNADQVRIETEVAVRKAYYKVLVNQEKLEIFDANTTKLSRMLMEASELFKSGFVEEIDTLRLYVALRNLSTETANVKRLLELGKSALKLQMGMEESAKLVLTDTLNGAEVSRYSILQGPADATQRIEYIVLQTTQKLQQLNIKRYKYGYLPGVYAYGSLQAQALRNDFDIFDTDKGWYPIGLIGGTIKVPLFDGLQKRSKIKQEKLTLLKLQNGMEQLAMGIAMEANAANVALQNALASLESQSQNKVLAEKIMNVSKIKYDEGIGTNLEVINAESTLREAVSNYYSAVYDAIVAKIDLDRATGNIK